MVIGLFQWKINNLGLKIMQKIAKKTKKLYVTFDTFGSLYS